MKNDEDQRYWPMLLLSAFLGGYVLVVDSTCGSAKERRVVLRSVASDAPIALAAAPEPARAVPAPPDPCERACSNLCTMFECPAESGTRDFLRGLPTCVTRCRAGHVSWNAECASAARTGEDVRMCGVAYAERGP